MLSSTLYHDLVYNMNAKQEPEVCHSNHVIDELSNRMHILELAFREQVFARETISREITDQSDVYEEIDKKLGIFLEKLENMTNKYADLESKYKLLSDRVYSDGTPVLCFVSEFSNI